MTAEETTQAASSADIKRLLGHIDAHTVAEIRESGATIEEVTAVAMYLDRSENRAVREEDPLTGRIREIYELVRADEARFEEEQ